MPSCSAVPRAGCAQRIVAGITGRGSQGTLEIEPAYNSGLLTLVLSAGWQALWLPGLQRDR